MLATNIYWIATALLAVLYLSSAALSIVKPVWVRATLLGLCYPGYLVSLMAAVKIAASIAILWRPNAAIVELAYAGVLFHMLLSGLAHLGVRNPAGAVPALVGLALLAASFATQNAIRAVPSAHALVAGR